jgi:copper chaperone NosL
VSKRSRTLVGVASLALLALYFVPLWSISLEAPQYPEGLGMHIWINTITGHGPNDLQNINGLNHYIGMQRIEPDSFAELRVMPWVVGVLILLGLAAAATGRRGVLYAFAGAMAFAAIVGMVDFYVWEYNYGHDLDPTAAIRVPGMSYQPPLIGSRTLLNFKATSLPALGGWIAVFTGVVAVLGAFNEFRAARAERLQAQRGG